MKRTGPLIFATVLALGGCAVVPVDERSYGYDDDDHYYTRETVIVTPSPRVEYRGYPPAAGYIWIDGYWNRLGTRHEWVSGYWAPPGTRIRPPVRHWQGDRDLTRRLEVQRERERNAKHERERERERERAERYRASRQHEIVRERRDEFPPHRTRDERRREIREQPARNSDAGSTIFRERRELYKKNVEGEHGDRTRREARGNDERRDDPRRDGNWRERFRTADRE